MAARIVYLTHYAEQYGANRSLLDLVLEARRAHGIEPFVILALDGPLRRCLDENGIQNTVVPFTSWMHKQVRMGGPHHRIMQRIRAVREARARTERNTALLPRIIALCRGWKIDLVHSNSSVIGIGGPLSRALHVPLVWHIRELPFDHYAFQVDGGIRRYRNELRQAQAIIAISDAVRREVVRIVGPLQNVALVPNGVADQSLLAQLRSTSHARWAQRVPFRFLQIGFFHPAKGQLEAVEAFGEVHRRFPQTRLVLAGGGRQEDVLKRIRELGSEHAVELPGFVEDPFVEMAQAHCLLQCSRHEAMGRVTVEAMASGIPVIGHASGATPELIQEGVTGHLYRTRDQLVALMQERILEFDRTRMLGAQAQDYAAEHFATEVMVRGIVDVYWSLLPKAMHSP